MIYFLTSYFADGFVALISTLFLVWFRLSPQNAIMKRKKGDPIRKGKVKIWIWVFLYATIAVPLIFLDFSRNFWREMVFSALLFSLPLLYLIPDYLNVRITLGADYFVYRNVLGDVYEVPYECIRQYKMDVSSILIDSDEYKLKVPYWTMVGIEDLLERLDLHIKGEKKEPIKMLRAEKNAYYAILIICLTISLLVQGLYYGVNLGTMEERWLLLAMGNISLGIVFVTFVFLWFFEKTYNIFFEENGLIWETGFTRVWGTSNTILYTEITQCKIGKFFIILHVGKTKYRFFKAKMLHDELVRHGVV